MERHRQRCASPAQRNAPPAHPDYLDHLGLGDERPLVGVDAFRRVVETARGGYAEFSVTIAT
jgi:hypothetical protein